jgi:glycosyltransferase involved in cell wall biosynthesis
MRRRAVSSAPTRAASVVIFDELAHDTPQSFRRVRTQITRDLDRAGVPYHVVTLGLPIPFRRSHPVHLLVSALYRHALYPLVARRHFSRHAVHVLMSGGLAQLLRVAPRDVLVTIVCHDVIPYLSREKRGHVLDFGGGLREWLLRVVQRSALRRAHLYIVPTATTGRDLESTLLVDASRIVIISHAIDTDSFHPGDQAAARRALGLPADRLIVFAIASPERRKNLECVMTAIRLLRASGVPATLLLVGHLSPSQRRAARPLALDGALTSWAGLSDAELARCYQAADCCAFLSLYEGFGYPALEAMGTGCPLVCSDRGSLPELVGDAALVVNPERGATVAASLRRVLTDQPLREALRAAGLRRAAYFATVGGYAEAFARLAEQGADAARWPDRRREDADRAVRTGGARAACGKC